MGLEMSNGYIVYNRGKNSKGYWKSVYQNHLSEKRELLRSVKSPTFKNLKSQGRALVSLAKQEREKEIALLRAAGATEIDTKTEVKEFIKRFNSILMGKKQFESALKRIEAALASKKEENRAPTIASYYTGYLSSALTDQINKFIIDNRDDLLNKNYDKWDENFSEIIETAIDESFDRMMQAKKKEIYSVDDEWRELHEISKSIDGFNQYFREVVRSVIDFNKIKDIFKEGEINLKVNKKTGVSTYLNKEEKLNLRDGKRARSVGGNIQETIFELLNRAGFARDGEVDVGSRTFTSNKMLTDNIMIYNFNQEIDVGGMAQALSNQLNKELQNTDSLESTRKIMKGFSDRYLSKLDNSFVVYGSTKSYSLSADRPFSIGGSRKLVNAADALRDALGAAEESNIKNLIGAALNTIGKSNKEGALFYKEKERVQDSLKGALMAAAAQLIFDDWSLLGNKSAGAKGIYVLQLEGIQIPLSIFLEALGEAMQETAEKAADYIKIGIKMPKEILYPKKIQVTSSSGEDIMSEIVEKWNEQKLDAEKNSTYNIHIFKSFTQIMQKWLR